LKQKKESIPKGLGHVLFKNMFFGEFREYVVDYVDLMEN
jgi:hypothetical protein